MGGGEPEVDIDKHKITLFLNISINCWKSLLMLCPFNFLAYKIYNLCMKSMNKIDKMKLGVTEIQPNFVNTEMFT